jgi:FkbM family methyltransferase
LQVWRRAPLTAGYVERDDVGDWTVAWITGHPLNRNRTIWAINRFLRWQIGSRLIGQTVVVDWVGGARFYVRTGETGLTGNIYTGLHEFPDMGFLLHLLRPGDQFADVGANAGSYTILAGGAVGADGVAIEPIPSTFRRLQENIRLNHLEDRVRALNIGVGNTPGTLKFTSGLDTVNHALADGEVAENGVDVEVSCLDLVLAGVEPLLMKIDVEGFETPVLEGAAKVLARPSLKAVIMELNGSGQRYGYDEAGLLKMMAAHGFETFSYDPFARALIELGGKNLESGNTLFIRDKAFVQQRLQSAPRYAVHGRTI